jgi:hypothetical protein
MTHLELQQLKMETERFLMRIRDCMELSKDRLECCTGGIETAAIRRASMDLTRALAQLRRRR